MYCKKQIIEEKKKLQLNLLDNKNNENYNILFPMWFVFPTAMNVRYMFVCMSDGFEYIFS